MKMVWNRVVRFLAKLFSVAQRLAVERFAITAIARLGYSHFLRIIPFFMQIPRPDSLWDPAREIAMTLKRSNPDTVPAPGGAYSHATLVPAGAELLYLAGQVGIREDGSAPADIHDQMRVAFANVAAILRAHDVDQNALVKLNIWLTEEIDYPRFSQIFEEFLGGARPSATFGYLAGLARPDLKVEVEAIAARMPG